MHLAASYIISQFPEIHPVDNPNLITKRVISILFSPDLSSQIFLYFTFSYGFLMLLKSDFNWKCPNASASFTCLQSECH